jgi:hypothetical protein
VKSEKLKTKSEVEKWKKWKSGRVEEWNDGMME